MCSVYTILNTAVLYSQHYFWLVHCCCCYFMRIRERVIQQTSTYNTAHSTLLACASRTLIMKNGKRETAREWERGKHKRECIARSHCYIWWSLLYALSCALCDFHHRASSLSRSLNCFLSHSLFWDSKKTRVLAIILNELQNWYSKSRVAFFKARSRLLGERLRLFN